MIASRLGYGNPDASIRTTRARIKIIVDFPIHAMATRRRMSTKDDWPREKRWKNIVTRSNKLDRARQLGIEYPLVSDSQLLERSNVAAEDGLAKQNVLFVCSRNQWRSPTGEQVWRKHPLVNARSGGTSPNARHKVSVDDIRWADVILVMEEKHKARLLAEFTRLLNDKAIHVLDIPDEYKYMDPALVEQLEQSVAPFLRLD
jgi:predicted protein tyrosine phosphatase